MILVPFSAIIKYDSYTNEEAPKPQHNTRLSKIGRGQLEERRKNIGSNCAQMTHNHYITFFILGKLARNRAHFTTGNSEGIRKRNLR